MKVFCIPYAGGSSIIYSKWRSSCDFLNIVPVELPGRGARFSESLCDNMEELIDKLFNELKEDFINEEYMIFGHSMGSLITFYLADKIRKEGIREPSSLFFSGYQAPDITKKEDISYKMEDKIFMKEIYELGGTPEEVINNDELCEIFLPVLKNDYKLIETCKYDKTIKAFDCDITVLNGSKDNLTNEDINEWKKFTNKKFEIYNFDGGHFFINDYGKEIINIMNKNLEGIRKNLEVNNCI